jgi:ABC-2 type transport system ATP-binding protein
MMNPKPRTTAPAAILLKNVTKTFKKNKKPFTAVDNVSLEIPRGQIFGLLGPNGAGKTTTISMICTLLRPTSGKIFVDGIDVEEDQIAARQRIGLVFQEMTLDKELTGAQNLEFHARLFKLDNRKKRVAEALKLVELTKDKDVIVKDYSGGMKRRLEIARSVMHDPAFILLDEPTLGLDPVSRRTMWEHIQTLIVKKGVTVLLTTHYLEEAERLCSRLAIMDKGKIVVQGTPEELKAKIGNDVVIIQLAKPDAALVKKMRSIPSVRKVTMEGNELRLYLKDVDRNIISLLKHFNDTDVVSLVIKRPTLDDVFLRYAGRKYEE